MTLIEKLAQLAQLTPEQREQFAASKDFAVLEALLSGQGIELTADEKVQAEEYLKNGIQQIGDDELSAVAGGKAYDPWADYYTTPVYLHFTNSQYFQYVSCPVCGQSHVYSGYIEPPLSLSLELTLCYCWSDCKCKACNKMWGYVIEFQSGKINFVTK